MKKKAKKVEKETEKKSLLELNISFGGPSLTQRVLFAKNMAVMLRSGMTVVDALQTVRDSISAGTFKVVLTKVIDKVESGASLSDAFAEHPKVFPDVFVSVTQAGESSGTLAENLANVAVQLKKDKDLVTKMQGAMIYPAVILTATFFLGMAVAFFILPQIVPLFKGLDVELPLTTQLLIAFSDVVEKSGMVLFVSLVAGFFAFVWLVRQRFSRPVTHWLSIKVPVVKRIVQYANLARFSNTLGTSLKSGISLDEALEISGRSLGNHYYKKEIAQVLKRVRAGSKLSEELANKDALFPVLLTRMISVGEESGNLEDVLLYLSEFYEEEVDASIKVFTTLLEPTLLLLIGSAVGFLALSIISPIYDITGSVQR